MRVRRSRPVHGAHQVPKGENNRRVMVRTCSLSEEQNPAYISTKLLQWQNKLAAQQAREEAEKEA